MSVNAPSDVTDDAFAEAVAWFRARVPITDDEFEKLSERAKRKSFLVSRVAHLDIVTHVWHAIEKALARGDDFADFRKELGEKLLAQWTGPRLDQVFRTNVQLAYGAGRWTQATDPQTLEGRPYWMFDAVLDSATSHVCKSCDGTILPADDPWWSTHLAPLHHNCRSGFITLTAEQARARGVSTSKPSASPDKGFGKPPDRDDWKPDPGDYPAELFSAAKV